MRVPGWVKLWINRKVFRFPCWHQPAVCNHSGRMRVHVLGRTGNPSDGQCLALWALALSVLLTLALGRRRHAYHYPGRLSTNFFWRVWCSKLYGPLVMRFVPLYMLDILDSPYKISLSSKESLLVIFSRSLFYS